MEVFIGFVLVCLLMGAYAGRRAPEAAEYAVEPAKSGTMQLVTFVAMTIWAGVVIIGGLLLFTAMLEAI